MQQDPKKPVKTIPEGYHSVTPFLIADDAGRLLDFMVKAFDGKVTSRLNAENGQVMHATVQIGDSLIMVSDAMEGMPPATAMLYLYVEDADAVYEKALKAKATSLREPKDEFYGDRSAGLKDAWGNQWWVATHKENLSPDDIKRRYEEFLHEAHATK
jgi:PhnB protein